MFEISTTLPHGKLKIPGPKNICHKKDVGGEDEKWGKTVLQRMEKFLDEQDELKKKAQDDKTKTVPVPPVQNQDPNQNNNNNQQPQQSFWDWLMG